MPSKTRAMMKRGLGALQSMRYGPSQVERSLVWMLGTPRSGSTWLLHILSKDPRVVRIDEFGIGSHLGIFTSEALGTPPPRSSKAEQIFFDARRGAADYVFSDAYASSWRPQLRALLLERLRAQLVAGRTDAPLAERIAVIKEPNGTQAAELILGVLPQSRLLALVRDGRDVVDSMVDAMQPESWLSSTLAGDKAIAGEERLEFVVHQGHRWMARTSALMAAYERHDPARRILVRYEDLLADTYGWSLKLFEWLGIDVNQDELERLVGEMSYENVPESQRGKGQFVRSASPGSWREGLRTDEQEALLEIMRPTLIDLHYEL